MWIEKLIIRNCRCLFDVTVTFSPHINIIVGKNASGKTSLLEALNILSCGRSFRTSHISEVISYSKKYVLTSASVNKNSTMVTIGIEKTKKSTKIRINRKDIYSQSELSFFLPVTAIHPDSVDLITGPSIYRRSFLDRIVFYTFPDFYNLWKKYKHILKQRNLCLRLTEHRYALDDWTHQLVQIQPQINEYRQKTLELFLPFLEEISNYLFSDDLIFLDLSTGFPNSLILSEKSLFELYKDKESYDIKTQRTNIGIHKADLKIHFNSVSAKESASRGQQKLLAISLLLAQSSAINSKGEKGILLIDDLAAELDGVNKERLLSYLSSLNQQIIITSTKDMDIKNIDSKVFHVKHGNIIAG